MNYYLCFFFNFSFAKFASFLVSKVVLNSFSRRRLGKSLTCFSSFIVLSFSSISFTTLSTVSWRTRFKKNQIVYLFLNFSTFVVFNTSSLTGTCWGFISSGLSTFVHWRSKKNVKKRSTKELTKSSFLSNVNAYPLLFSRKADTQLVIALA